MAFVQVSMNDDFFNLEFHFRMGFLSTYSLWNWIQTLDPAILSRISISFPLPEQKWMLVALRGAHENKTVLEVLTSCFEFSNFCSRFELHGCPSSTSATWFWKGQDRSELIEYARSYLEIAKRENDILNEFDLCVQSGTKITAELLKELSLSRGITTGHWLFHVIDNSPTSYRHATNLWKIVLESFIKGELAENCTGISIQKHPQSFVIQVSNDYAYPHSAVDETEYVQKNFQTELAIRESGIKCELKYKPDIYSICQIYVNNQFNLRPTFLISQLSVTESRTSVIDNDYTDGYEPDGVVFPIKGSVWYNRW